MLTAQHKDATRAMRTTSGAANPAYATTITSPPATAPAGATLLTPNAVSRADPMASWASSRISGLPAIRFSALPGDGLVAASRRRLTVAGAGGRPVRAGFLAEGGHGGF